MKSRRRYTDAVAMQADGASSSADVQPWEVTFPILSQLIVVATAIGRDSASAKVCCPLSDASCSLPQYSTAQHAMPHLNSSPHITLTRLTSPPLPSPHLPSPHHRSPHFISLRHPSLSALHCAALCQSHSLYFSICDDCAIGRASALTSSSADSAGSQILLL